MLMLTLAAALAADAPNADIVSEATVPASPDALVAVLTDLTRFQQALAPECVGRFVAGTPATGKGATGRIRYDMAAMHRDLTFTITRLDVDPARSIVDFDHASRLGFITRWTLSPGDLGTLVNVKTALNPPPWPFARYYFAAIQPEWAVCQAGLIQRVAKLAGGS